MAATEEFDGARLQRKLASRVFFIFLLPYVVSAVLVVIIFVLSARVKEVELALKLVNIERIWTKDKNYDWAIDQYSRLAKQYNRAEILVRLGALYFGARPRNETTALETLARAKALDREYWQTYSTLAYIHLAKHNEKEARVEGEAALRLNPFDAQTYNNLAWLYATSADLEIRNLEKAKAYAEKAVWLTRETQPNYLDTLAEVYFRSGQTEQAREQLRKAIAVAPNETIPPLQKRLELLAKARS